jgi:hypothetical protein
VEKRFGYCEYSHIINIATYCESNARAPPKPLDFLHKAPTLSLTEAEKPCRGRVSDGAKRLQSTGIKAKIKEKIGRNAPRGAGYNNHSQNNC